MREITAILAIDEAGAIGREGGLLCHLPDDLRRFKALTMGHSIVMGRKTFESFPCGPLPGRQNIVVTRNRHYPCRGITVAGSLEEALAAATLPGEVMVIGGAQIYRAALPLVTTLQLTLIHHTWPDADTFFPPLDPAAWRETWRERHEADARHPHPFTFITLQRIN